ncbi:glycoside hydrolase family 3 protein [Trichococcus shcherbakoviae]|uniref:beta-N-acetylhexosaminidase n=1 Tax=Trichococcus shcherbakoviae subsp. psychrophilus TaxID=2585775 RepID=A0A5C5E5H7_9LACT|nr:glycoside hydrolase family 3 N-terminal domain-containing protein [Trichococcus shcherbakoviae]TNV68117.1 glycoside hydrolase family 3 protein [Trichococcus shcherbakoviae subsp. psychrophilus]
MVRLTEKPFFLTDDQISWVENTLSEMTVEEKIGQIFCPIAGNPEDRALTDFVQKYQPGGMMFRPMPAKAIRQAHGVLQNESKIPLLLAANLEAGGNGICSDGTYYGRPMGVAATADEKEAYQLGFVSGREAQAVGCNWAFSPIVDIDMNFKNPITNVRTFGSDVDQVIDFSRQQMKGLHENGIATAVKHFPGDGVDERDQHLVSTVNSLSVPEWDESYGKVYKAMIEEGALSVMIGHILQPAYSKALNPTLEDKDILPASLSTELVNGLLRDRLGFNGVAVTDATPMIGYNAAMSRKKAIPTTINAGCDMILFNKNIDEDYQAMRDAVSSGDVSMERLDEAITRILAMKASMGLVDKQQAHSLIPAVEALDIVGCPEHLDLARKSADKAITLVKDTQNLLPISLEKTPRVRVYMLEDRLSGGFKDGGASEGSFIDKLSEAGFTVETFNYEQLNFHEIFEEGVDDLKAKVDLVIYVANYDTASNQTTRRIDWIRMMAADAPWFVQDVPTLFVSLANPYHLFDAPMIKTYINGYSANDTVNEIIVEKLIGKSEFQGKSPVDPFCGVWGTNL